MSFLEIANQRLSQQRIARDPFTTPSEAVAWLGAVQSQDYPGAKWSLGMRVEHATEETIERAFNAGEILRTHIMRPTWHFVIPADIRWIQQLTAPRVKMRTAYQHRSLELDEAMLMRCGEVFARALEGGKQLTRGELGSALAQSGIIAEGQRLGHITHSAEMDGVICSGPRRGKQFTYMLLAERAPQARNLPRDEALAELTRRYFTGHGPATARDFSWWSGLTIAEVKAGLDLAAPHLASEMIEGQRYYYSAAMPPAAELTRKAFLLPTYDEYHVGYTNFGRSILARREERDSLGFDSTVVFGERIIGIWRRTIQKGRVVIELAPLAQFKGAEEEAIGDAANEYGKFTGLPVDCVYKDKIR